MKVLLKIVRRLLETRLEAKSNRKTEKVRKDRNRRIGNCDWTMVEAELQDWNRKITQQYVELSNEKDEKYIGNCTKTTGNNLRSKCEEESWEDK